MTTPKPLEVVLKKKIFFLNLFRATPMANGSSQASGRIRAVTASLHHSHSNAGSEPHLWPTPHPRATLDPQPTEQGKGLNLCPHECWSDLFLLSHNRNSCSESLRTGMRVSVPLVLFVLIPVPIEFLRPLGCCPCFVFPSLLPQKDFSSFTLKLLYVTVFLLKTLRQWSKTTSQYKQETTSNQPLDIIKLYGYPMGIQVNNYDTYMWYMWIGTEQLSRDVKLSS